MSTATLEAPLVAPSSIEQRCRYAAEFAEQLMLQRPDWVTFFREVLGTDGCVAKLFRHEPERRAFDQTPQAQAIQAMLRELRGEAAQPDEPTRVITVRLPKSLHESLRSEAHDRKRSMNQLCIAKLLQVLDPAEGPPSC